MLLYKQALELTVLRLVVAPETAKLISSEFSTLTQEIETLQRANARSDSQSAPIKAAKEAVKPGQVFRDYAEFRKNPEVRRLEAIRFADTVESDYAELFRTLRLSSAELAAYKQILLERIMSARDARYLAIEQNIWRGDSPIEYDQILASATAPIDAQIRNLIGDDGVVAAKRYVDTTDQRNVANQLQSTMADGPDPLSEVQRLQLVDALAANPAPKSGASQQYSWLSLPGVLVTANVPKTPDDLSGALVTDAAVNAVVGILSPAQISRLRDLQAFLNSERAVGAAAAAAQAASGETK